MRHMATSTQSFILLPEQSSGGFLLDVYVHIYIHNSYATLSSGVPWNVPQVTCIFMVYTLAFRQVCKPRKYK